MEIVMDENEKKVIYNMLKDELGSECDALYELVDEFIVEIKPSRSEANDYFLSSSVATINSKMEKMRKLRDLLDKYKK